MAAPAEFLRTRSPSHEASVQVGEIRLELPGTKGNEYGRFESHRFLINLADSRMSMNMVGVPYREVHF